MCTVYVPLLLRMSNDVKENPGPTIYDVVETESQKQTRLENDRKYQKTKQTIETQNEKQTRLENARKYWETKRAEKSATLQQSSTNKITNQQDYLKEFDIQNGSIHEQGWAKHNIDKFHKSVKFSISQCTICYEAWPLKSKPRSPDNYVCSQCSRDNILIY